MLDLSPALLWRAFAIAGVSLSATLGSIFLRKKSKQRFESWASFWSSNQIADLSLFAGNGELAKRGSPPPQTLLEGRYIVSV